MDGDFGALYSGLMAKVRTEDILYDAFIVLIDLSGWMMEQLYQTVSNSAIKFMIYERVLVMIMKLLHWIRKVFNALIFAKFVSNANKTRPAHL